jgi:hypothetical protein
MIGINQFSMPRSSIALMDLLYLKEDREQKEQTNQPASEPSKQSINQAISQV